MSKELIPLNEKVDLSITRGHAGEYDKDCPVCQTLRRLEGRKARKEKPRKDKEEE